jgi:hypothetical protein
MVWRFWNEPSDRDRRTGDGACDDRQARGHEADHAGADKAYDVTQFVHDLRDRSVTPHIAIDGHLAQDGDRRAYHTSRRI